MMIFIIMVMMMMMLMFIMTYLPVLTFLYAVRLRSSSFHASVPSSVVHVQTATDWTA